MFLYCARIYIGGAKLAEVAKHFPKARQSGKRVYVGYDNATGLIYNKADKVASQIGGYVETEAD
jgi:hypothetical protein